MAKDNNYPVVKVLTIVVEFLVFTKTCLDIKLLFWVTWVQPEEDKEGNMDKQWKIVLDVTWTESGIFMKYSIHSLDFTCSIPWNY